jgi:dTMP kinase
VGRTGTSQVGYPSIAAPDGTRCKPGFPFLWKGTKPARAHFPANLTSKTNSQAKKIFSVDRTWLVETKLTFMFITFEGPDGGGKTLQLARLVEYLEVNNYPVLATREPGGTSIGEQIREVLHSLENTKMHPRTELLLYQASRAQHVEQVILPNLEQGIFVLCDRYADSTLAYQGYGHQMDLEQLGSLIDFATGGLKPDLTLLLDIDAAEGLKRREEGGDWNRLDAYDLEFHQRVRQGYYELAKKEPQRWVKIDAAKPPEEVHRDIRQVVMRRLDALS